jgi:hypothetical protein
MATLIRREPVRRLPTGSDAPGTHGENLVTSPQVDTVWCAVGGGRGGDVVPRWFDALADLGARHANLFWAMPDDGSADVALERLRSVSTRWIAELRTLGIEGSLSIKRGAPGPWLVGLSGLDGNSLVVVGPPTSRGVRSATIQHLLHHSSRPLLLLPDLVQPPIVSLWTRVVVDAGSGGDGSAELDGLPWAAESVESIDLASLDAVRAVRTGLRFAEDVDATMLVLPRRSAALAPLAMEFGNFPVLVPPAPSPGKTDSE